MDERLLRFFVAVYEEKNLSRAAEKCFVSQPNISNGIKQLETILGRELFTRHKRGVEIKEDAHYLYPIAKRIISELHSLPGIFQNEELRQKVTFGIADSLPQEFKRDFFIDVINNIEGVELDLRPMSRDCDINILVREWKYENHLFLPLWKEDYVLCIPNSHHLSTRESIDIEELAGEPFIHCPPCEAHQQCISILHNFGEKWNTIANCSSKTEVLTLLMAGVGISFLPEIFISNRDGFRVVPHTGPKTFREIGLSYSKESLNNPLVHDIINFFSSKVSQV